MDQVRTALIQREVLDAKTAPSENTFREALKDTRLDDLTEFGRVVHGEMHALLDAARRGVSTNGATLYCTTFPCHNCAKHIVAAGIKEVRYIAPYPKSLAEDLHPESIVVEPDGPTPRRVRFVPFKGISPAIYAPLFVKTGSKRRKEDGTPVVFDARAADPKPVPRGGRGLSRPRAAGAHRFWSRVWDIARFGSMSALSPRPIRWEGQLERGTEHPSMRAKTEQVCPDPTRDLGFGIRRTENPTAVARSVCPIVQPKWRS